MHSLFPFLQNSHPRLSYHSTYSFALQKYCQILMATWGFFSFSNTLFYLSPLLTIHPSSGLLLEKFLYMAFKKRMKGKKKNPYSLFKQLIMHVEFLLSLCFYLSFLHIAWEHRIYPICDPVLCWDFEVSIILWAHLQLQRQ